MSRVYLCYSSYLIYSRIAIVASALCYELHDDNGTPDEESDDIIVGWMVMELYDVSLFGGSVITTYFDLDGNEVQESEIDYDHVGLADFVGPVQDHAYFTAGRPNGNYFEVYGLLPRDYEKFHYLLQEIIKARNELEKRKSDSLKAADGWDSVDRNSTLFDFQKNTLKKVWKDQFNRKAKLVSVQEAQLQSLERQFRKLGFDKTYSIGQGTDWGAWEDGKPHPRAEGRGLEGAISGYRVSFVERLSKISLATYKTGNKSFLWSNETPA